MNEYERIAKSDNDIKGKYSNELKSKNSTRILEDYEQLSAFTEKEYSVTLRKKKKLERVKTYEYGDITSIIITTENDKNKIVVFEGDVNGTLNFKSVYEVEGLEYNDIDEFKETITLLEEKGYAEDFNFKTLDGYEQSSQAVFKKYLREADRFISGSEWTSKYRERYLRSLAKGKRNRKGTSYSNGRTEAKFSTKLTQLDNEYLELAKEPVKNEARLREMVGEVAEKAGYTDVLYHGTKQFGFTEFDASKSDDKISFFVAGSDDIAQTYSGKYGSKIISSAESVDDLSIEDVVNKLREEAKDDYWDMQNEYEIMHREDVNALIEEVNSGVEKLQSVVDRKIKDYAEKLTTDFDDKDVKTHKQLVELNEILDDYQYEYMSTPIYMLLHHTDAFSDGGVNQAEIAELETNIRLMNRLINTDTSGGVVVNKQLGGYGLSILTFDDARTELKNKLSSGNYALFGKPGKQFVVDCKGSNWNDITYYEDLPEELKSFYPNGLWRRGTTRDVAQYAKSLGYDSVKFENVVDNGGRGKNVGAGVVYAYFNPNNLKSADLITYDDNGNVIPLSERFNENNKDIRYSTKLNSEGEQLSEGQAEYFKDSKVRDEDGNLLKVYHGTSEDFTVFDRTKGRHNMDIQGSFFSPWELDAQGYGENVKAYYLNITNPASEQMGYKALRMFRGQNNAGVKAREYLESLGYDGVNNGNEEYIAFNSNQIKLADNLNPTESEDVRYSVKEQYKNNDIVNLSEDSELKILIGKKTGADKYNAIKDFVWGKLGNKVIVFSDGLRASIDKKDALHIANKSADKKTAEISAVDELIAKSKPYAYDDNVEHKKFSYFKYYESILKFGDDIYPIYLNVGKTKNDGTYRLYDITHKIRDTAHRFNDVGRLQEFLPANSISTDKVTQNMKTVKSKDSTKLTPEEYARQIKALEKENSLLVEDNKYLKELVSIQGKLTKGKLLDSKSVDAVARNLVKKFNADGNSKELSALLQDYYSFIISSKELNWQDVLNGANKSAEWITSSVPLYHQLISRFELQILLIYRQVCFQPPKSPL